LNRAGSKNLAFVGFDRVVDGLVCDLIPGFSDAAEMEEPEVASCSWPPGASILPPTCTCVCLVSFQSFNFCCLSGASVPPSASDWEFGIEQ
jgi:hypothetical protein